MSQFEIVINFPDRPETVGQLAPGSYRIGSSPAAHIQLKRPEVSGRHAMLTVTDDKVMVEDAGSTNGTFLDGRKIGGSPMTLPPGGGVVRIGDATLTIRLHGAAQSGGGGAGNHHGGGTGDTGGDGGGRAAEGQPSGGGGGAQAHQPASAQVRHRVSAPSGQAGMLMLSGIRYEYRKVVQLVKRKVHGQLIDRLNLKNLAMSGAEQSEIARQARTTIQNILLEMRADIPPAVEVSLLEQELVNEAIGLGPVEMLLANPEITEIMVNGPSNIYVEMKGVLYRTDLTFADDTAVQTAIERIVAPLGRRIDESSPLVDARLPDGSRVNAIIPPLAIDGPTLTIRKFAKVPLSVDILVEKKSLTYDIATFLKLCVICRKNILISGGTGTGKTTLLNVISNFLPNTDRIVTIEDAAELQLAKDHVVRLESRPPNIEGRGEIGIRELVKNALRMRPDRIVVGECRGGEALDMLQAMNTGHDGSLTTIHANTARDALARLETLVMMSGYDLPLRAIREQIAAAITLIVQIGRLRDGSRRIVSVTEVTGMEGEVITTQDIFEFEIMGQDSEGRVNGRHKALGIVPTFAEEFRLANLDYDIGMFKESP